MSFKSLPAGAGLGLLAALPIVVVVAVVWFSPGTLPGPAVVWLGVAALEAGAVLAWPRLHRRWSRGGGRRAGDARHGRGPGPEANCAAPLAALAGTLQRLCGRVREVAASGRGSAPTESAATVSVADPAAATEAPAPTGPAAALADAVGTDAEAGGPPPAVAPAGCVGAAVREMETIAATVDQAARQIKALMAELHPVSSIATVIGEIAIQTELLALNAAFEAARTGGTRAHELVAASISVRKLARSTCAASEQIERTALSIQVEAGGAENAIAQVGRQVRRGVELAQGAADGGQERAEAGLATVGEDAPAGSALPSSIVQHMERIARMVEGSSASMASVAAATSELERLAQSLNDAIGRFRG